MHTYIPYMYTYIHVYICVCMSLSLSVSSRLAKNMQTRIDPSHVVASLGRLSSDRSWVLATAHKNNVEAQITTYTILVVPHYNSSIMGPKTLF